MPTLDPRVDAYIERAAPFAQDILRHWRATVHAHCPILKRAMQLIEDGVKARPAKPASAPKPPPAIPDDLAAALRANDAAARTFEGFPPSQRREYIDWIVEAKKAETREKRLAQAIEWMAEGKRRHWKYENC